MFIIFFVLLSDTHPRYQLLLSFSSYNVEFNCPINHEQIISCSSSTFFFYLKIILIWASVIFCDYMSELRYEWDVSYQKVIIINFYCWHPLAELNTSGRFGSFCAQFMIHTSIKDWYVINNFYSNVILTNWFFSSF